MDAEQGFYETSYAERVGPDGPPGPQGPKGVVGLPANQVYLPNLNYGLPGEPMLSLGGATDWYIPESHGDSKYNSTPPVGELFRYRREGNIVKFRGGMKLNPSSGVNPPLVILRPGFLPDGRNQGSESEVIFPLFAIHNPDRAIEGCHAFLQSNGALQRFYGPTTDLTNWYFDLAYIEYSVYTGPEQQAPFTNAFPGDSVGYLPALVRDIPALYPSVRGQTPPPPLGPGVIEGL